MQWTVVVFVWKITPKSLMYYLTNQGPVLRLVFNSLPKFRERGMNDTRRATGNLYQIQKPWSSVNCSMGNFTCKCMVSCTLHIEMKNVTTY